MVKNDMLILLQLFINQMLPGRPYYYRNQYDDSRTIYAMTSTVHRLDEGPITDLHLELSFEKKFSKRKMEAAVRKDVIWINSEKLLSRCGRKKYKVCLSSDEKDNLLSWRNRLVPLQFLLERQKYIIPDFWDVPEINLPKNPIQRLECLLSDEMIPPGVKVVGSVTQDSLDECKRNISKAVIKSLHPNGKEIPAEVKSKAKESLFALDDYRNSKLGLGNISSGFTFLQEPVIQDYVTLDWEKDTIYFDNNPVYPQVIDLLANPENQDLFDSLVEGYGDSGWMIPNDTCKYVSSRRKGVKKGITKTVLTKLHVDSYPGIDRTQGYINDDGNCKLFFLPRSNHPEVREIIESLVNSSIRTGFSAITWKEEYRVEMERILSSYAVTGPRTSLTIWEQNILHWENWDCEKGWETCTERFRLYVGINRVPEEEKNLRTVLALAAEKGLVPAWYHRVNKNTPVEKYITCGKTTQWKKPRLVSSRRKQQHQEILDSITSTDCIFIPEKKRLLYGLSTGE